MKQLDEADVKKISLEILEQVHIFCEKKGLQYTLFFGSLLGAIRHKGFIPWDDDIDLAMPRKDYEIFVESFGNESYGVMTPFSNEGYYLPWGKVYDKKTVKVEPVYVKPGFEIGVNIDIFPLDEVFSYALYKRESEKQKRTLKNYRKSLIVRKPSFRPGRILLNLKGLIYNGKANKYSRILDEALKKANKGREARGFATIDLVAGVPKYYFPINLFENRNLVPFEGREYWASDCFDEILSVCYGNYLTLPPVEQRTTHHLWKAFRKDR